MNLSNVNGIVFEGGGTKGVAYAGALKILDNNNLKLENVKYVAGASAGAIAALLIALGYTTDQLKDILWNVNYSKFQDAKIGYIRNTWDLFNNYGWHPGNELTKWIESFLQYRVNDKGITFKQLHRLTRKHLKVVGTNVTAGRAEVFDHESTPDMPVALAIRISISIPIFFHAVKYNGNYFVDGGVVNNYPIRLFDGIEGSCIIGMRVDSSKEVNNSIKYKTGHLLGFVTSIVEIMHHNLQNQRLSTMDWDRTVVIDTGNYSATNFNLNQSQIAELYEMGVRGANGFIRSQ